MLAETPDRKPRVSHLTTLRTRIHDHRAQLRQAFRVTVAAVLSLAAARLLDLPMPLWAVLTAIIVTQLSVGRSLKATIDYLSGTFGGAVWGAAVAVVVPHASQIGLFAVLALAVAPLAVVAARRPGLTVAPITAVLVILLPAITHAGPVASALDRAIEVALGGIIGFAVSFLVVPANAHRMAAEAAATTLDQMAEAFAALVAGLEQGLDMDSLHRIQDHIGQALAELDVIRAEARHERAAYLAAGPDPGPLVRALLRLRHDLVMVGRVALMPLPEVFRLRPALARIEPAFAAYLRSCGAALRARQTPPPLDGVDAAVAAYAAEVALLRRDGLTRNLPGDGAERLFALGFALEQIHRNCAELGERLTEWAAPRPAFTWRRAGRSSTRSAA